MYKTKYQRPSSVEAAASALSAADEGKILAGGQTLLPTMKQHLAAPTDLVDIRGAGLSGISIDGDTITIGATTTHAEVAGSKDLAAACPALCAVASGIGDPAVRHMGTIGGSVANNDPAADYPAAILGLDATIVTNSREIAADDFFTGLFSTALEDNEIIISIRVDRPTKAAYAKFPNPASRYALVGVFAAETRAGTRIAVTGAGEDGVFRHDGLEKAIGGDWSEASVDGVTVSPEGLLSDIHATSDYRANLVGVMTKRAVLAA